MSHSQESPPRNPLIQPLTPPPLRSSLPMYHNAQRSSLPSSSLSPQTPSACLLNNNNNIDNRNRTTYWKFLAKGFRILKVPTWSTPVYCEISSLEDGTTPVQSQPAYFRETDSPFNNRGCAFRLATQATIETGDIEANPGLYCSAPPIIADFIPFSCLACHRYIQ